VYKREIFISKLSLLVHWEGSLTVSIVKPHVKSIDDVLS